MIPEFPIGGSDGLWGDWLAWIDSEQRVSQYGTAAGVVSAIGGLSSIAISIYLSSNGERIRAVRRHYQQELRRVSRSGAGACCGEAWRDRWR